MLFDKNGHGRDAIMGDDVEASKNIEYTVQECGLAPLAFRAYHPDTEREIDLGQDVVTGTADMLDKADEAAAWVVGIGSGDENWDGWRVDVFCVNPENEADEFTAWIVRDAFDRFTESA